MTRSAEFITPLLATIQIGQYDFSAQCRKAEFVAGRHYLTKPDLNALYFATYRLPRLRG